VLTGFTSTFSRCSCCRSEWLDTIHGIKVMGFDSAHLFQAVCVHQNPAQLDDLGGIARNINAMLVTRCGYMYHHIPIDFEGRV